MDMMDRQHALAAELAGSYVIERELGRGGMATVYLAQDVKHERRVALKVVHPAIARTVGRARFAREIRLAAGLQHPHVLTVLDSGETAGGQLWFTMPYADGESLRDRLERERQLPVGDAVQIIREAADGLGYAHRHGVVHRDVKPENILLTERHAVVADFGIACALSAGSERITEAGMAVGTPAYMSPEQAAGEGDLDGRSDIYSLGCVLYEALAGVPPFTGPTPQAVMAGRMSGVVSPVRRVRPAVSPALDAVVTKALALIPADRYASAGDLVVALNEAERVAGSGSAPVSGTPARRRWIPASAAAALGLGFLIGAGVLFAWRRHDAGRASAGASTPSVTTLAVLPFENLGDSAHAYFADGVTDAVRDKLAALPALEVIARTSSDQVAARGQPPSAIGRALGAKYLLTGTVRWARAADGTSRVEVRPELVDAATAAEKWGEPFDASMTDVFRVQASIASQVAEALGVALSGGERKAMAERPTTSLEAYDAYLRAQALARQGSDVLDLQRAARSFRRAVAADTSFALAWAGLSSVDGQLVYEELGTGGEAAEARTAARRAVALAPNLPEARAAMGGYYAAVRQDQVRALAEYEAGLRLAPHSVVLLSAAGRSDWALGRWKSAIARDREAQRLDPRSAAIAEQLGRTYLWLHRLPEARMEFDRAIAIAPGSGIATDARVMVSLAAGDLAGARAVVKSAEAYANATDVDVVIALYYDLTWVLDRRQQRAVLASGPASFGGDRGAWGIVLAEIYRQRGDSARARAYADSAEMGFAARVAQHPRDGEAIAFRGLALAYLGQKAAAVREGERAIASRPTAGHAVNGPYMEHLLARIYIANGEPGKALDILERLVHGHYYLTPAWLRIDPNFDPLRGNPRFERLVGKKGSDSQSVR